MLNCQCESCTAASRQIGYSSSRSFYNDSQTITGYFEGSPVISNVRQMPGYSGNNIGFNCDGVEVYGTSYDFPNDRPLMQTGNCRFPNKNSSCQCSQPSTCQSQQESSSPCQNKLPNTCAHDASCPCSNTCQSAIEHEASCPCSNVCQGAVEHEPSCPCSNACQGAIEHEPSCPCSQECLSATQSQQSFTVSNCTFLFNTPLSIRNSARIAALRCQTPIRQAVYPVYCCD